MMIGATLAALTITRGCGLPDAVFARLYQDTQVPIFTGHDSRGPRVVVTLSKDGDRWSFVMLTDKHGVPKACVVSAGDGALFHVKGSGR